MKEYTVKVYEDGSKCWLLRGLIHREDGPAIEYPDGTKRWLLRGLLHREDGPAIEWAGGDKSWYLDGEQVTEEEHKRRTGGVMMEDALARLVRIMGTFDLATGHADTMDKALDALGAESRDVLGHLRARRVAKGEEWCAEKCVNLRRLCAEKCNL